MSTEARRCWGASISTAGRRSRRSRSRFSAAASKGGGMPGLRLEHRNAFHGVVETERGAWTVRGFDRRRLAGRQIAWQLDPAVSDLPLPFEELRDEPIRRLPVDARADGEVAG